MQEATDAGAAPAQTHAYALRFTASGSEYFRIWIVNLLLIAVTFGIYWPWAKARKLQYFYSNTLLDGHSLDFHGDPLRMLRGMLVAAAFFFVYSVAGSVSGMAAFVAAMAFLALWPLMVRASLRFRLANTSWRGLRLRFTGGVAEVYAAVLPPMALVVVPLSLMGLLAGDEARKRGALPGVAGIAIGLGFGLFALASPYFFWRLKRYQHSNYALGALVTGLRAGPLSLYGIVFKTFGVLLLGMGVAAVGGFVIGLAGAGLGRGMLAVLAALGFIGGVLFFNIVPKAYAVTRLQNLLWTQTGNQQLRFRSALAFGPYARLQLRNFVLIAITLGFYWPFAVVANLRARLEAVTLHTRLELDQLAGNLSAEPEATGDAAADLFGVDVGF